MKNYKDILVLIISLGILIAMLAYGASVMDMYPSRDDELSLLLSVIC